MNSLSKSGNYLSRYLKRQEIQRNLDCNFLEFWEMGEAPEEGSLYQNNRTEQQNHSS